MPGNTRWLRSGLSAAFVVILTVSLAPTAQGATAAEKDQGGPVRFENVAVPGSDLHKYRRAPSPAEHQVVLDLLRRESVTLQEISALKPVHDRGIPGVVVFDYDRDTDLDLFVSNGPGRPNSLFRNRLRETGRTSFVDVGNRAGVGLSSMDANGACAGDIDNDGHSDLYILGRNEPNHLLKNRGNGTFADITASSGAATGAVNHISCSMADFDGNGLVDIAIANGYDMRDPVPTVALAYDRHVPSQLLRNDNGGRFTDVSDSSGFTDIKFQKEPPHSPGTKLADMGLAIAAVDYDQDGDVDIVIGNDQGIVPFEKDGGFDRGFPRVHRNDGTGHFEDVTLELGLAEPGAWMGLSFGDFNFDGRLDFFGSNLGDYILRVPPREYEQGNFSSRWFLQRDNGTFADVRRGTLPKPTVDGADPTLGGLGATPWGWGTSTLDYNNDGYVDILYHGSLDGATTVIADNQGSLLRNKGPQGLRNGMYPSFTYDRDAVASSGADHARRTVDGVAVGDLDNNGFVDMISVAEGLKDGELTRYDDVNPGNYGSPWDRYASFLEMFRAVPEQPGTFQPTGNSTSDGNLTVEMNKGNGNNSATVRAVGSVGVTQAGKVNRDGIGAVMKFTPHRGATAIHPVTAGSSFVSQNALEGTFGMGRQRTGTLEILWPGGVRNKVYDVRAGERVVVPEIPCSYADTAQTRQRYAACVTKALDDHVAAGTITRHQASRFFASAIKAFQEK